MNGLFGRHGHKNIKARGDAILADKFPGGKKKMGEAISGK